MSYPNISAMYVERRVREIAEADPEHVYAKGEQCTNIEYKGSEACLIGRALMDLGVDASLFIKHDVIDNGAELTLAALGIPGGAEWLNEVQSHQDQGAPWRLAIQAADEDYPRDPDDEL